MRVHVRLGACRLPLPARRRQRLQRYCASSRGQREAAAAPASSAGDWLALLIISLLGKGKGQRRPRTQLQKRRLLPSTRCLVFKETRAPGRQRWSDPAGLARTTRESAAGLRSRRRCERGRGGPPRPAPETPAPRSPCLFQITPPQLLRPHLPTRTFCIRRRCRNGGNHSCPRHPGCGPLGRGGPSAR